MIGTCEKNTDVDVNGNADNNYTQQQHEIDGDETYGSSSSRCRTTFKKRGIKREIKL